MVVPQVLIQEQQQTQSQVPSLKVLTCLRSPKTLGVKLVMNSEKQDCIRRKGGNQLIVKDCCNVTDLGGQMYRD